jgi:acetylornithine/succinyldiaminopimelate/putrescine aminotransferase
MGRTGSLFAFEAFGITPDILTLAKAFGGGLPIGCFVADHHVMKTLTHDPALGHITTFGGNPVCCASALAVLEVMENERVLDSVEAKGKLIEELLVHPRIRAVRRAGMMFAIDFDSKEEVAQIVSKALELGVITFWFLSHPNSFRIAPPLTITEAEIHESCEVILQAIRSLG